MHKLSLCVSNLQFRDFTFSRPRVSLIVFFFFFFFNAHTFGMNVSHGSAMISSKNITLTDTGSRYVVRHHNLME